MDVSRVVKAVLKCVGATVQLHLILSSLSPIEVGGILGVAVKCLDITTNADCEGGFLDCN